MKALKRWKECLTASPLYAELACRMWGWRSPSKECSPGSPSLHLAGDPPAGKQWAQRVGRHHRCLGIPNPALELFSGSQKRQRSQWAAWCAKNWEAHPALRKPFGTCCEALDMSRPSPDCRCSWSTSWKAKYMDWLTVARDSRFIDGYESDCTVPYPYVWCDVCIVWFIYSK